jgi:hypothetical protein
VVAHAKTDGTQHAQGILFENRVVDSAKGARIKIGLSTGGINERERFTSCQMGNDCGERDGDSIEREVALAQIFFYGVTLQWRDIEADFLHIVFDDDTTGFIMHMRVKAAQLIGKLASYSGSVAIGGDIPIGIGFMEQQIAHGASHKIGFVLVAAEEAGDLL